MPRTLLFLFFLSLILIAPISVAAQNPTDEHPLIQHMARTLTGDDSQWRTPNPDYEAGTQQPREYGLRFRLEPDRRHVTGELTGRFEDGREVIYWSMLAFYNPVTERVITQQIGWDGALVRGQVPVQAGPRQTIDATLYAASGDMRRTRHEMHFVDADTHLADVYEYGPDGQWQLVRKWQWKRHATPGANRSTAVRSPDAPSKIEPYVAHLLSGSGQWRAPNPDYQEGGKAPKQYALNYRWGPHRQHVIGEIVSIYADDQQERQEKDWSLYITHNPVTGRDVVGANRPCRAVLSRRAGSGH